VLKSNFADFIVQFQFERQPEKQNWQHFLVVFIFLQVRKWIV